MTITTRRIARARYFEKQQQRNGGYCNTCKDFAGELLANFDLTEGKEARIRRMDREFGKF